MIDAWAQRYFEAWKTNDPALVASLFTADAVYWYGPFREPARGRDEIVRRWVENAPPADVRTAHEVIAVNGETAVIHWRVSFDGTTMDGVLVVKLDAAGACYEHREWYEALQSATEVSRQIG